MRRVLARTVLVPGVLLAMLLAVAAPAAADEIEVIRWDSSTCASDGAPSPVVHVENTAPGGYQIQYWIDATRYTLVRVAPGEADLTLDPVIPGEHVLASEVLTTGSTGEAPSGGLTITAPACPAGSPAPSANAYPRPADPDPETGTPVLSGTFGAPYCPDESDSPGAGRLPFTFGNSGDAEGVMVGLVDGQESARSTITPGTDSSTYVSLLEGTHTYALTTEDGTVLDSEEIAALDCSGSTDDPTDTTPTATGESATAGAGTPAAPVPGPQTPAVVQTDGAGAGPDLTVLAAALATLLLGGAATATLAPVRRRRH